MTYNLVMALYNIIQFHITSEAVFYQIGQLRRKIGKERIESVYGIGYRLKEGFIKVNRYDLQSRNGSLQYNSISYNV